MDNSSHDWVKAQLVREMAQVKAPDSLWPRIQAERRARRAVPKTGWILWPVVATVMLVASGDLVWQSVNAASKGASRPAGVVEKATRARAPQTMMPQTMLAAMAPGVSCGTCHVESGLY